MKIHGTKSRLIDLTHAAMRGEYLPDTMMYLFQGAGLETKTRG